MPWRDPAGRFSAFKLAVFILLFVPAIVIAFRYDNGLLGPRPLNEALRQVGTWALRLILISLLVTPARRILQWPRLMQVRRMIGVAAFTYAAAHLTLYITDEAFDLRKVATEILLRIYLTIGFAALLILTALASTSTNGMIRRLGGKNWRRLHRLVYLAALLGVVHFFLQSKLKVDEPFVMAGLFVWLMGYRLVMWFGAIDGKLAAWWPTILALAAAAATAIGESIYYWIKVGVSPLRVLETNLSFDPNIRPAWFVLAICLIVAAAGALRPFLSGTGWRWRKA
ncbi:MAG: protein-methionine-sulfoxide reductase heme-binding subunit MsrQ [Dongiaceae bacterium]